MSLVSHAKQHLDWWHECTGFVGGLALGFVDNTGHMHADLYVVLFPSR